MAERQSLSGAEFVSRQRSSSLQPFSFDPIAPHVPNILFHVHPSRQPPWHAVPPTHARSRLTGRPSVERARCHRLSARRQDPGHRRGSGEPGHHAVGVSTRHHARSGRCARSSHQGCAGCGSLNLACRNLVPAFPQRCRVGPGNFTPKPSTDFCNKICHKLPLDLLPLCQPTVNARADCIGFGPPRP
jgi:hypothetical protein